MGKSTLLALLEGQKFNKTHNKSTNGLVVSTITLPRSLSSTYTLPLSPRPKLPFSPSVFLNKKGTVSETIQFNIMDFGGQEVFHSTHRLFLTANAIYIVMFNLLDADTLTRVEYLYYDPFRPQNP